MYQMAATLSAAAVGKTKEWEEEEEEDGGMKRAKD